MTETPAPAQWVRDQKAEYAHGEHRPEGSFTVIMGAYGATLAASAALVWRSDRKVPSFSAADLALVSVATHKLSRLVAKDPVTSPLRMPFVRFAGTSGEAELAEEVRGTGWRKAVGELVTGPFCPGLWVATGFGVGIVLRPDLTRLVAFVLTSLTAADDLQSGTRHWSSRPPAETRGADGLDRRSGERSSPVAPGLMRLRGESRPPPAVARRRPSPVGRPAPPGWVRQPLRPWWWARSAGCSSCPCRTRSWAGYHAGVAGTCRCNDGRDP